MRIWLLLAMFVVTSPLQAMERREFARRMSQLSEGDSRARVEELLGRPDAIQTEADWDGLVISEVESVYCYGSAERLGYPTLGSVALTDNGTVKYVWGGEGEPPASGAIDEGELRRLMYLLDKAPEINSGFYDPRPVIAIVNALQPLGKDKSVLVLSEFFRVLPMLREHESGEGMILVMRTLFDVPDPAGYMGRFTLGGPRPGDEAIPDNGKPTEAQRKMQEDGFRRLPRFPIVIEDDIPFLYVAPFSIGGFVEPPVVYLEEFKKSGSLRESPLRPGGRPVDACQRVIDRIFSEPILANGGVSKDWCHANISRELQQQTLRLVMDSYELPKGIGRREWDEKPVILRWDGRQDVDLYYNGDEATWTEAVKAIAELTLSWDEKNNRYVRE